MFHVEYHEPFSEDSQKVAELEFKPGWSGLEPDSNHVFQIAVQGLALGAQQRATQEKYRSQGRKPILSCR